jgi:hypothetical protein
MFGFLGHDYLRGPWEVVRGSLIEELDQLQGILRRRWGVVFGEDNQLRNLAISGDGTVVPRYVSNEGENYTPEWNLVDVQNGVQNRLQYGNLEAATDDSLLFGRGSAAGAGNWQEVTLGAGLLMDGTELSVVGGGGGWVPVVDGAEPPVLVSDGAGVLILVAGPS